MLGLFMFALMMAGGMPGAHGLMGKDFGMAVSGLTQIYPGVIADHIKAM